MKTEKELEYFRYDIAMFMPYMPIYKDYEVYDQRALWFQYLGLFETRYMSCKSFNKKHMNTIKVKAFLSFLFFQYYL